MGASASSPFGRLLRAHRVAAGLSQERLAERAGLSLRGISDLERGARRTPRLETVRMLCDALGLSPEASAPLFRAARALAEDDDEGLQRTAGPAHSAPAPLSTTTQAAESTQLPASLGLSPAAGPPRTSLPLPLTALIDREAEVAAVVDLLRGGDARLVTLTGPGGVGKTRVALQVAAELQDDFDNGVHFVDLAAVRDAAWVTSVVARTLAVPEAAGRPLDEVLGAYLGTRKLLLVLDNFEHLLAAAPRVAAWLAANPGLKVLATSRARLGLRGERTFTVPPLAPPDPARLPPLDDLAGIAAVRLFVARAQEAEPQFALTATNAPAVAEICTRLDGLPLAIELAAARSSVLPPLALVARLEHRLPLLRGGPRDLPVRQQTLRATLAWSHDLLAPADQVLFRRLAVFVGGFDLAAATAVASWGEGAVHDVLDGVTALLDQQLALRLGEAEGEPRFGMLETVREYGLERLQASGEEAAMRARHAALFLALAEAAVPHIHGPLQDAWLDRLEREHSNLRAALAWATGRGEAMALRLGAALWLFWLKRGHWSEARAHLAAALASVSTAPAAVRAEALLGAGALAGVQGEQAAAQTHTTASLDLWRQLGSRSGAARALTNLGVSAIVRGDGAHAASLLAEAVSLFDSSTDEPWAALATSHLGVALTLAGDAERGLTLCEAGLARQRAAGDRWAIANMSILIGDLLTARGEYARAAALFAEGLEEWKGSLQEAVWPFAGLVGFAGAAGQPVAAARLGGALAAICERLRMELWPQLAERARAAAAVARATLGEDAFAAEWAAGRAMSPEQVLVEAQRLVDAVRDGPAPWAS